MLRRTELLAALLAAKLAAQAPTPTLRVEREIVPRGGSCSSLAWSADGNWVAAGGYLGDVLVVDANTGHVLHELVGADHCWIGALRFAPDRSVLFVAGRELTRWDLATGEPTAHVELAHPNAMALSRDGRRVAYTQSNDTVIVANADDLQTQRELKVSGTKAIEILAFDPKGEQLALQRGDRTCRFSLATGEQVAQDEPQDWVKALAYRDDGRLVRLDWRGRLLGFTDEEQHLGISASGMSVDARASLCVAWEGPDVRGLTRDGTSFAVAGGGPAAVHPDGASWARVHDDQLEIHRGAECVRRLPLALRQSPYACVFSRNGRHLAFSGQGTTLFDLDRGAFVPLARPLQGMALAYAAGDDDLVLWAPGDLGSDSARLTFWSIAALLAGGTAPAHTHTFTDVVTEWALPTFSRDGRHFALGNTIRATRQPEVIQWSVPADIDQWVQPMVGGEAAWRVSALRHHVGFGCMNTIQRCRADGAHDAEHKNDCCRVMGWSPDGTRMILTAANEVRVVAAASMETIATIPVHVLATWLDDERLLVLAGEGQLAIVSAATGTELARTTVPARYGHLAVAADGKRCACVLDDRVVVVRITP